MASLDKLQEHAATIMTHLEDANMAAMEIQSHDKTLKDMAYGFEAVRIEVQAINHALSNVDDLIANLKP